MNSSPRHNDLEKEDSIPTVSDDSLDIAYDPQMDNDQIEDEYEEEYEEDVFRSKLYQPLSARLQRPTSVIRQASHPPSSKVPRPYSSDDTRKFTEEDRRFAQEQVGNNTSLTSGGKCYVVYPDKDGQIVGGCVGKEKFMECSKQLCQRLLDVSLLKLKDQLQPRIDMVRKQMDEKFDYRDHQLDTSWFVNELGVVLKRIRSELHTMWKKGGSSRDAPAPPGIEIDQWHRLIDYWMSENFRKLSMRMKDNRKKVQIGNLTGRLGKTGLLANLTPVSATEEVKKTNRPDLYNSLVYLKTTQNEMKQEQFTIKKEQMELNKGLLTLNSKMDDLMTILLGEKKSDLPSHLKKKEDVSALKMAFEVGDGVELREVKNGRIILGVGRIMGLAGKSTFHSQTIQPGYANILVIKVFAPDAPLVVPNLDDDLPQRVLSDAVGSSVLWPEGSLRRACLASKGP
ncbi:hypothetical protein R1sor_006927 [Riccia sorocarpa]|uniref:Transposase Tnp1/En/Spm-like domain-containing protein n=1 Tax=Riccia sorocarpa TaxID=122646 RepID=A0ABD3HR46_9MARC